MNADSVIDNRGVLTQNLFTYCGNNPVNNEDSSGHIFGAAIGGIVGGILGGLTAVASGKSIKVGIVTGAVTGAVIGAICDVTTSGLLAAALCAGVAAGGNAWNQYENYKEEMKQYYKKQITSTQTISNKPGSNTAKSVPKKYQSFANYVDRDAIATAAIAAAVCAPLAVAGGTQVNSVFNDLAKSGINTVSRFIAEWAIGTNVSVLQTSVEYIIPIFEP